MSWLWLWVLGRRRIRVKMQSRKESEDPLAPPRRSSRKTRLVGKMSQATSHSRLYLDPIGEFIPTVFDTFRCRGVGIYNVCDYL